MSKFNLDIIYRPEKGNQFNEEEKNFKSITLDQAQKIICDTIKEEEPFDTIQIFLFPEK